MSEHDKSRDLDWLYRRDQTPPEPDPTRVMPEPTQVMPTVRPEPGARAQVTPPRPVNPPHPSPPRQAPPPPPAAPVRVAASRRPRRRSGAARTVLMLLMIALAWLIGVPLFHLTRAGSIDATPTAARPADQPGTAILLAGNDARPNVPGARTDSMMILFIPDSGKPALISLPRDSFVEIPGHGHNKLNAAYAFGGPKLLVQTVESVTGLRIDGYLEVSMQGFPKVVDAVGGVELCLKKPIKDSWSKSDFPAGCQHMNGAQALSYSRMRKADPRGDLGRMERQREVIAAVTKEAISPASLLPWRYWKINEAGSQLLIRSSDTSITELGLAGSAFQQISAGRGISVTVPISNANATTSAGSSILWDQEQAAKMFSDLSRGDTSRLTNLQR